MEKEITASHPSQDCPMTQVDLLSKANDLICLNNQVNKCVKNQREYNSEEIKFGTIMMIREGRK